QDRKKQKSAHGGASTGAPPGGKMTFAGSVHEGAAAVEVVAVDPVAALPHEAGLALVEVDAVALDVARQARRVAHVELVRPVVAGADVVVAVGAGVRDRDGAGERACKREGGRQERERSKDKGGSHGCASAA